MSRTGLAKLCACTACAAHNGSCPAVIDSGTYCPRCAGARDRARGSAADRGYDREHRERFRHQVLARDPLCRCDRDDHDHLPHACIRLSTVADHWPRDRRQLVADGADPNDPDHGRGLCATCDPKQTAARQPGGWNAT